MRNAKLQASRFILVPPATALLCSQPERAFTPRFGLISRELLGVMLGENSSMNQFVRPSGSEG